MSLQPTIRFKVVLNAEDRGEYDAFTQAFKTFYLGFLEVLEAGNLSEIIDNSYILLVVAEEPRCMRIYRARDFASQIGLLAKGDIREDAREPTLAEVETAFLEWGTRC